MLKLWKREKTWWARGWINGTYVRRTTGWPVKDKDTKDRAGRRVAEIDREEREQQAGWKPTTITLREYWTKVYEKTYTRHKRAGRLDRQMMAHALPEIGDVPMSKLTVSACHAYLNERRQAFAANPGRKTPKVIAEGTVQREHSFLAAVFERAKVDKLIAVNPWRGIKRTPYAVRVRLVDAELQAELLRRLSPEFGRWLLFMLGTGLRLAECIGIDPDTDLDLIQRRVTVTGKGQKTRTVPIPAALVPVLKEQLKVSERLWPQSPATLRAVLSDACRGVEPSPDGTRPQWSRKAQAALPKISPHDLRHTFGHRWLKGGGDLYTLAKILGHSDIKTTQRHYAHLLTEDIGAKADLVELGL
jgi:integrase